MAGSGGAPNQTVKPLLEVSGASLSGDGLRFNVYRTEGVDTYGSFLVRVRLTDGPGKYPVEDGGGRAFRPPTFRY